MGTLKLTVKNSFDRGILGEGRNYGFGFAFVTPEAEDNIEAFKTMQAFTACKDYLNDLVYVERHNEPLGKVYGFEHTYTGAFKDKEYVYLGVKIVHYNNGGSWNKFKEASDLLKGNYENLVTSINKLEEHIGLSPLRTTLHGTSDTELVFRIPKIWAERGWLISLLTLWIRCFFNISAEDVDTPIKEMITNQSNKIFIDGDKYLFAAITKFIALSNFKDLLNDERPKLGDKPHVVHNLGISGFVSNLKTINTDEEKKKASTIVG